MRKSHVTIYDLQMRKVAYLENAFSIQYETPMNNLWTASFSLPANDPKNKECQPLYFAEIFDQSERVELFRILPSMLHKNAEESIVTYQCEHVLDTLLDDILFQHHTIGNLGVYTPQVIQYILDRQNVQRWKLGTVSFNRQFEYNWENENLLGALFSIPKPFDTEYMWTWDTTKYPWTLNLVEPPAGEQARIRYGVNMQGIEKIVDPSNVVTRIYGLGFGEGVNQLNFADINGGKPYLDAEPEYIQKYGIMKTVFVDRRFEYADTLKARCQALLDELKQPRVTYIVQASELYALTKDPIDKFRTGAVVRVQDNEIGEDVLIRIQNVRKQDVVGAPGNVEIEIANRPQDIAGSIAELRNRQYINEVYAQGATNINTYDFADNCDPQHPAIMRFFVPGETANINKIRLNYQSEAFRAYSKAIEGGGAVATTSGPSSRETTASGGQTTSGPSSTSTTASGGAVVNTRTGYEIISPEVSQDETLFSGLHNHGIPDGTRLMTDNGGAVTYHASGEHAHRLYAHGHRIDIPPHSHDMPHTHQIGPHTHGMDHTHSINLPNHTHGIEYGIYQGPTPTAVTVRVDGKVVPGLGTSVTDVDIIPYLSKDGSGRVQRGTWHTIEIAPNSLGRIVANVVTQIFVQSRGGGNF